MKKILFLFLCTLYTWAQTPPKEPKFDGGGFDKFYEYLSKHVDCSHIKTEDQITITFGFDSNGKAKDIRVVKFNSHEAARALVEALNAMPVWDVSNQESYAEITIESQIAIGPQTKISGITKCLWHSEIGSFSPDTLEKDSTIYNSSGVEVKPEFPGGINEFYQFIGKNYRVPNIPDLKGKLFISFVVDKDGSLTDIKVLKDIGFGTGEEAIRVLKLSPTWTPAVQNGRPVRCSFVVPFVIQATR